MIDVISSSGWLKPALLAMELSQMVTQAMWATDSPLWQLPFFNRELVAKCKEQKVNDIVDFINMEDAQRNKLLDMTPDEVAKIAAVCNRYPAIEMKVLPSGPVKAAEPVNIGVDLSRELDTDTVPPVHAPYYPQEKEEYWWVVVGDPAQNKLLAIKRLFVARKAGAKLSFVVNDPGTYQLKVYLICDSYVGVDQEESVTLSVLPGEASNKPAQSA